MTIPPTPRRKHSKGTPHRGVRIPDDLWDAAKAKAARLGVELAGVQRGLLRAWVEEDDTVSLGPVGDASKPAPVLESDTPE